MSDINTLSTNRSQQNPNYFTVRYALIGVGFGLLFPLVATIIALVESGLPLSLSSLITVQLNEPLLWIIDMAPIILGVFAAFAGRREDSLHQSRRELVELVDSLETRVVDRTRDLDRAVEVGHGVTQVSDVDRMLVEAVDLVRSSFNLYSVQLYLTDAAGRNLVLGAGSGAVGATMVAQSQRVPLSLGSLVGAAAVEKQTIVEADPAESQLYQPYPRQAGAWSEMAMPLLIGDRVIGVLDLQSDRPGQLSTENLPALEAVAAQLAIAIEHARLVSEATEARAEIEAQASRLARRGWEDFLNAIDRSEVLGYAYDPEGGSPEIQSQPDSLDEADLAIPISVTGESVGAIQVKGSSDKKWSDDDLFLVSSVADQVARQIENLRLLAEADRYRSEAEAATRRLTREGWDQYKESAEDLIDGYIYSRNRVLPLRVVPESDGRTGRSALYQDLTVRGEPIGRLEVTQVGETDEEAYELVSAVAVQLSAHLENLRLTEQTEKALSVTEEQARRLAALNDLSQALAGADSLDDIYRITANSAGKIIPSDRTSIAILKEGGDRFEILALKGDAGATRVGDVVSLDGSVLGRAVRENRVVLVNESADSGIPGIASFIVAPLIAGGRTIGTLNLGHRQPNRYNDDDKRLVLQVASLLASSIESRRLFTETERRAEELAVINQIARAVSQQLELDQLLETVYEQIQRVLPSDSFHIGLYKAENQVMDYPIIYEDGERSQLTDVPLYPESNSYEVIRLGEPIIKNLSQQELKTIEEDRPRTLLGDSAKPIASSLVYVPLRTGRKVSGIISLQSYQPDAYRESQLNLLNGIANYVAVALDNANLYQEARIRADELAVLNEMGRALTSLANIESVINTIYEHTARLIEADSFYVALYDANQERMDVRHFALGEQIDSRVREDDAGWEMAEYVIRNGEPLLIRQDTDGWLNEQGIVADGPVAASWLGVPMMTADQVSGVVAVQDFSQANAFDRHQQDLLTAVASQAAIAIDNTRLFEQVQGRARRERILRQVTARVRSTADVDSIMRTAAQEVGRALGRQTFVYLTDEQEAPPDQVEES